MERAIESERYSWNKAAIRLDADVAREKGVIVRLERDGSITVSPLENAAVDEVRALLSSKKIQRRGDRAKGLQAAIDSSECPATLRIRTLGVYCEERDWTP